MQYVTGDNLSTPLSSPQVPPSTTTHKIIHYACMPGLYDSQKIDTEYCLLSLFDAVALGQTNGSSIQSTDGKKREKEKEREEKKKKNK